MYIYTVLQVQVLQCNCIFPFSSPSVISDTKRWNFDGSVLIDTGSQTWNRGFVSWLQSLKKYNNPLNFTWINVLLRITTRRRNSLSLVWFITWTLARGIEGGRRLPGKVGEGSWRQRERTRNYRELEEGTRKMRMRMFERSARSRRKEAMGENVEEEEDESQRPQ